MQSVLDIFCKAHYTKNAKLTMQQKQGDYHEKQNKRTAQRKEALSE